MTQYISTIDKPETNTNNEANKQEKIDAKTSGTLRWRNLSETFPTTILEMIHPRNISKNGMPNLG